MVEAESPAPAEAVEAAPLRTPLMKHRHCGACVPAGCARSSGRIPKARSVRPAVGNTGSLFFTADADTPSSVTRHLFEPIRRNNLR